MKEKVHEIIEQLISHDIGKNEAVELVNELYVGYKPKFCVGNYPALFYCDVVEIIKTPEHVKDHYELKLFNEIFKVDALDLDKCYKDMDQVVKLEKRLLNSLKTKP